MTESVPIQSILTNENNKSNIENTKKKKGEIQNVQSLFSIPNKYEISKGTPRKTASKAINAKKIKVFGDELENPSETVKSADLLTIQPKEEESNEEESLIREVRPEKLVDYKEDVKKIQLLYKREFKAKRIEPEEEENLIKEVRKERVVDYKEDVKMIKNLYKRKENPVQEEDLQRKVRKQHQVDLKTDTVLLKMKSLYQKKSKF